MQLQPVEPAFRTPARGAHELGGYPPHVRARHRARQLIARSIRDRGRRNERPVALGERLVGLFPTELRRALRPGMPELEGDLGGCSIMHVADDPLPRAAMLVAIETGASGRS